MATKELELEGGRVIVRGWKTKEGMACQQELKRIKRQYASDPDGLDKAEDDINLKYLRMVVVESYPGFDLGEIPIGEFAKINETVKELSGGGESGKKSMTCSGTTTSSQTTPTAT